MKRLPLGGIQTFREIIENNLLYADKTEFIYRLSQQYKGYFLTRPRRFGKSLLLSTMEELFLGNRELFKGLWIDSSDYGFPKHPVLTLSMDVPSGRPEDSLPGSPLGGAVQLSKSIVTRLGLIAGKSGISLKADTPALALEEFVTILHQNFYAANGQGHNSDTKKKGVVILIDEYDKPISDHADDPELARANLAVMRSFYGTIKTVDKYLRFVFVTGASKIAKSGISSGGNQLEDISLDKNYGAICGFTPEELDSLFRDRLEDVLEEIKSKNQPKNINNMDDLRAKIMAWFDGYSWDGVERVLNPLSILKSVHTEVF